MDDGSRYWSWLVEDLGSTLICFDDDRLYLALVLNEKEQDAILRRLDAGEQPSRVLAKHSTVYRVNQLLRIEVQRNNAVIDFY
jgi:hypothetical protein